MTCSTLWGRAMAAWSVPVLYPADVSEFVPYALLGWALSRYSGCWVGLKCLKDTVESTGSIDVSLAAARTAGSISRC